MLGLEWMFDAPPDTIWVISELVFTANHLTDTDKQNGTGKYTNKTKHNTAKASKRKMQQNRTIPVQSPHMTLGQETRWKQWQGNNVREPTWQTVLIQHSTQSNTRHQSTDATEHRIWFTVECTSGNYCLTGTQLSVYHVSAGR